MSGEWKVCPDCGDSPPEYTGKRRTVQSGRRWVVRCRGCEREREVSAFQAEGLDHTDDYEECKWLKQ